VSYHGAGASPPRCYSVHVVSTYTDPERHRDSADDSPKEDHFVRLDGVTWSDYVRLLAARGDRSAPRISYLEGALEIMSPSFDHEAIRSLIGRLVEAYCLDRDIEIMPVGSWTLKDRRHERGAEPDECYVFGGRRPARPDLAIEVIWTSGGLDKLEIYRALGVGEVWVWRKGKLRVHLLGGGAYRAAASSRCLPDLDLALLCRFLDRPSVTRAVRDFRAVLETRAARGRH